MWFFRQLFWAVITHKIPIQDSLFPAKLDWAWSFLSSIIPTCSILQHFDVGSWRRGRRQEDNIKAIMNIYHFYHDNLNFS
jgi:hypothetical protein